MIRLHDLLRIHDRSSLSHPTALPDSLGDGWLLAQNPVFARLRELLVQRHGFRFSSSSSTGAHDRARMGRYLGLELLCLEEILEERVVPYVDNVTPLRHFAKRTPAAMSFSPAFITDSIRKSSILHESAHAVAHAILFGVEERLRDVAARTPEDFLLRMSIAEAFANTVEHLAFLYAKAGVHTFFVKVSSYYALAQDAHRLYRGLCLRLGESGAIQTLLLAYVLSNLRPHARGTTRADRVTILRSVADESRMMSADDPQLVSFCDAAFELCPSFRTSVATAHFGYLGVDRPLETLESIDLTRATEGEPGEHIARLVEALASLSSSGEQERRSA